MIYSISDSPTPEGDPQLKNLFVRTGAAASESGLSAEKGRGRKIARFSGVLVER